MDCTKKASSQRDNQVPAYSRLKQKFCGFTERQAKFQKRAMKRTPTPAVLICAIVRNVEGQTKTVLVHTNGLPATFNKHDEFPAKFNKKRPSSQVN